MSQGLDNGDGNGTAADGQLHVDEIDSVVLFVGLMSRTSTAEVAAVLPPTHSHWQHPLFLSQRRNQRNELWKSDGTASGTVMVKDINSGSGSSSPPTSQPLATPSISEPTTEPTDTNCGRAMEQPQAR